MSDQFKQAMRRFASSIAIVTSAVEEEWSGIAATAVMSVAADPPTIAVAINRSSSLIPVLDQARCFNVNLLAPRHAELVAVFGGQVKGRERFEAGDWQASTRGLPVLADAVAGVAAAVHGPAALARAAVLTCVQRVALLI